MKGIFNITVILLTGILFMTTAVNAGNPLPSLDLRNIEGQRVDLKSFGENDKITVIAFWATWCSPCRRELDNIYYLLPEWREKYDMEFVAISVDDSRTIGNVESFVKGRGWDFTVLTDENEDTKRALNFSNIPYSLIVDKDGNIVYNHSGYSEGDEYLLEEQMEKISEGLLEE